MNKKPLETTENAITYLRSLSDEASSTYGLQNRVTVVSAARKVIAKCRMKETVQAKIELIEHKIQEVIKLSKPLTSKGLPFFWEEMGPLLSQKDYKECLVNCRSNHNKFEDMQQALSGKSIFDKLVDDFELWFDLKAMYCKVPRASYSEAMELKAQDYDMDMTPLPSSNMWRIICQYGSVKLPPHQ